MDRITEVSELREHLGSHPDRMNVLVPTSATVFLGDGDEAEERWHVAEGTSFQLEGFVLHPRKLEATAVELVLTDPEEVDYVLGQIRESTAVLAALGGEANTYAVQRMPGAAPMGQLGSRLPVQS